MIEGIPERFRPSDDYLIDYWAGQLGVSSGRFVQAAETVGWDAAKVRRLISEGTRIAFGDQDGVERVIARIVAHNGDLQASVPYHPQKSGLAMTIAVDQSAFWFKSTIEDDRCYVVDGTIKLSMHMSGLVQYSKGGKEHIVSGYNEILRRPKGVGLKFEEEVNITTGPLFLVMAQGLHGFAQNCGKNVELFTAEDLWHDPTVKASASLPLLFEFFMLSRRCLPSVASTGQRRTLSMILPNAYNVVFPTELRILEYPGLGFVLGVAVRRALPFTSAETGYAINGPSYMGEDGRRYGLMSVFPRPERLDAERYGTLNYSPSP